MFRAIKEQIDTIFREDPAAKSVVEIILCYPGFHAILLHRFAHRLYRMRIPLLPRVISQTSRFFTGIEIHPGARSAGASSSITAWVWSLGRPQRLAMMFCSIRV